MENNLKLRTKQFSLMILEIVDLLPPSVSTKVISYQIAKSGTSVGANYRALVEQEVIMNSFLR